MTSNVPNVQNTPSQEGGMAESKRYTFRMFINQYGVITLGVVVVAAIGYGIYKRRKWNSESKPIMRNFPWLFA